MKIGTALSLTVETLTADPEETICLLGGPGVGKTSIAHQAAAELGIPEDRILVFRPSFRDPVDLMGIPSVVSGETVFCPPAELAAFRQGTGRGMIIWDELPQGIITMQNAIAGAMLDRVIGRLHIDRQVMQIATGNRTTDRAGANRIVTQLGNRMMFVDVEADAQDFCNWCMKNNIDPSIPAFIKLRPDMLDDFNPDRHTNPTPRSWEKVAKKIKALSSEHLQYAAIGLVGESAAVEYMAFRNLTFTIPGVEEIVAHPETTPVSEEPGVLWALSMNMSYYADEQNIAGIMRFAERMPLEFTTTTVKNILTRKPSLFITPAISQWTAANAGILNQHNS